jgi:hypothetical protein
MTTLPDIGVTRNILSSEYHLERSAAFHIAASVALLA